MLAFPPTHRNIVELDSFLKIPENALTNRGGGALLKKALKTDQPPNAEPLGHDPQKKRFLFMLPWFQRAAIALDTCPVGCVRALISLLQNCICLVPRGRKSKWKNSNLLKFPVGFPYTNRQAHRDIFFGFS